MIARRNDANARFNSCICTTTTMAVRSVCSSPCTAALFSTFASGLSPYSYLDHLLLVYLLTHLPETTAACGRAVWLCHRETGGRQSVRCPAGVPRAPDVGTCFTNYSDCIAPSALLRLSGPIATPIIARE